MGSIPKILTSYVESVVSFLGKKTTMRKNHKHKTEKTYFINIFTIHKYSLKEFATNVIL